MKSELEACIGDCSGALGLQPPDAVVPAASKLVALAKAFCDELVSHLTTEELDLARERNRAETSEGVCHSQDFCDANMLMHAALVKCGLLENEDAEFTDDIFPVWNAAWDLAMAAEFHVESSVFSEREEVFALLRAHDIESYCQQICGGGNCGTRPVCQYGIDAQTEMPVGFDAAE